MKKDPGVPAVSASQVTGEKWDSNSHMWSSSGSGFLLGNCFHSICVEATQAFVSAFIYCLLRRRPHGIFLYLQESRGPETVAG